MWPPSPRSPAGRQRHIRDILTATGIQDGPVTLDRLPAGVRASLAPHLAVPLTPLVRVEADLTGLLAACIASSLVTDVAAETSV
ncbi:hypothetical protein [Dactylosporangium sp. NPDC048998]|uniref:hypothetical protein n=1 Tax=Dactylosporangium sp. NPDC048998 TaxID=3363976 RepID=UPI00371250C8